MMVLLLAQLLTNPRSTEGLAAMYESIIVAANGSEIADKAVQRAMACAKNLGSKRMAVTVAEPFESVALAENMTVINPAYYKRQYDENANNILTKLTKSVGVDGTACKVIDQDNHWPYDGVTDAVEKPYADLSVMGSHGRRGLERLLPGSHAAKLRAHTKTATMVMRKRLRTDIDTHY
ncbi:MAG: universal stress protein [Hyphomicrobiaceae bacterium]